MTPEYLSRLDQVFEGVHAGDEFRMMDWRFEPTKLHSRSPQCWAVVGQPSGAIVESEDGVLLMRLGRDEAAELAEELTSRKNPLQS